jgi:uncharacterized membrane protein
MNPRTIAIHPGSRQTIYLITLFVITLTGFAQMPIFKRYYIADIPGLGWLDEFYVTHYLHYLAAAVLLAVVFDGVAGYLLMFRKHYRITVSGRIRGVLLFGLVLTGALMVVKNFSGYWFSQQAIIAMDILHIALTVFYLSAALWALVSGKKWIENPAAVHDMKPLTRSDQGP